MLQITIARYSIQLPYFTWETDPPLRMTSDPSLAGSNGVTSEERSLARSPASPAPTVSEAERSEAAAAVMAARSEEGRRGGNGWRRRSVRSVSERAVCNNEEQTDLEPRKEVFAAMHNT